MPDEAKKIIIDEDWKSQVQAEKESAQQPPTGEDPAQGVTPEASDEDPEMPPASFEMLLSGLATEALMALGQIPHPVTGEAAPRLNLAKYLIDTIGVLQEKTKDNVSQEESQAIDSLLHQLRMVYVAAGNQG